MKNLKINENVASALLDLEPGCLSTMASLQSLLLSHKDFTPVLGLPVPLVVAAAAVDEGTVFWWHPCLEVPSQPALPCSLLHKKVRASDPPSLPWGQPPGWEASLSARNKNGKHVFNSVRIFWRKLHANQRIFFGSACLNHLEYFFHCDANHFTCVCI